jgi:eukaryotic-like serine/threonine-protein kinase
MSSRVGSRDARPWPTAADYMAAVQDPGSTFHHPALAGLRLRPGLMGLPAAATGQNAVVFDADGPDGRTALRCFTSVPARGDEAYRLLEAMELPEVLVPVTWREDALDVNGVRRPVVTMPWVVGDPLHRWVGDHLHLPTRIAALADAWVEACRLLVAFGVAHGDLQHGNVLVTATGELRIIDFDGVLLFHPTRGTHLTAAPTEVGHPNYQHPQRIEDGHVSRYVDTFSALVIHTSLRALVTDPGLWSSHSGENLVLAQRDLFEPEVSETLARMRRSDDPVVARGADLIARWCRSGVAANVTLADVLGAASATGALGTAARAGGYRSRAAEREAAARAATPVAEWTDEQRPATVDPTARHAQYRGSGLPPEPSAATAAAAAPVPDADGTVVRSPRDLEGAQDRTLRTVVLPVVLGLGVGALLLVVATLGGLTGRFLPASEEPELPRLLEVGSCFVVDASGRVLPERCSALNDGTVVAEVAEPEACERIAQGGPAPFALVEGRAFCLADRR